jgi:hypothetical protein
LAVNVNCLFQFRHVALALAEGRERITEKIFNQFRPPGKAVILYPPDSKSGELIYPFAKARDQ